ncbi:POTRA domain-containing protein [Hyphomicrobium sp. CS1BSMeth3]|uniref:ShlB/FhaC/HecB family hemolysin secretion/activation protein n=1 Tax=Hyphomicrobium sp. CS1BSMeth3 TaxID=1892844 RepID=UPI001FCE25E1|nr:POTRA domain-containing protein [Hyphomicrobium sp. CS1BSMeth3]
MLRTAQAEGATQPADDQAPQQPAAPQSVQKFSIDEFRVDGATSLAQADVEAAIYPFLGPDRSAEHVDKARAALEKAYHDKGFQTVSVSVPAQNVEGGTVILTVTEARVANLRVKNSRYFDQERIREAAPSLKEGTLPNFTTVTQDLVALNQWPDRRITPALRAGMTPGTIDVDLNVEDKLPLHASVELANRQSPNTTPLRLTSTVRYDNLWQRGHSLSLSYQVAPQRPDDAEVISGSYLTRVSDWTSVLVYGVDSKSDVATVGGMNVIGPGQVLGVRALLTLPYKDNYFHSLSFGIDYKHFGQIMEMDNLSFSSPITYYPLAVTYTAGWQGEGVITQANVGATFNLRGPGSGFEEFWTKRAYADSNFFHFNADVQHTRELPAGYQLFAKVQGQIADGALISSEQFSVGGLETVRGYLESEAIGDTGVSGTIEVRTPDIGPLMQTALLTASGEQDGKPANLLSDWRLFGFVDAGTVMIHKPLVEQGSSFTLWSYGVGTRFKLLDYFSGSLTFAMPMTDQSTTSAREPRVLFSVSGSF